MTLEPRRLAVQREHLTQPQSDAERAALDMWGAGPRTPARFLAAVRKALEVQQATDANTREPQ